MPKDIKESTIVEELPFVIINTKIVFSTRKQVREPVRLLPWWYYSAVKLQVLLEQQQQQWRELLRPDQQAKPMFFVKLLNSRARSDAMMMMIASPV